MSSSKPTRVYEVPDERLTQGERWARFHNLVAQAKRWEDWLKRTREDWLKRTREGEHRVS